MSRETTIQVRVSHEEKAQIVKNAEDFGVSPSDYLRSQALFARPDTPIPYETQQDKKNKVKVRKAVENEEPYEVKIEPGTDLVKERELIEDDPSSLNATLDEKGQVVKSTTDSGEDERQGWIRKREIQLQGRMSTRAAQLQARQDWNER